MHSNRPFAIIGFWFTVITSCATAASGGLDVVTMNNGDIFNGRLEHKFIQTESPYGSLSIPIPRISEIQFGKEGESDYILTHLGDTFSSRLLDREMNMSRVLAPTLPLTVADMADITISPRKARLKKYRAPDTVETRNGDLFAGRISSSDFMLKTVDSLKIIARRDLFLLEFMQLDNEPPLRAQATLNNGQVLQGDMLTKKISLTDRYSNKLEIPLTQVHSLAFQVNHRHDSQPQYNYREHVAPAAIIQDRMRSGHIAPRMIVLRGGNFRRGDLQGDGDTDEQPAKPISLKPYAIGMYEVTFQEYDHFCDNTRRKRPDDGGWGRGRRPVVNISWNDASAYAAWLGGQTGKNYRLPSDAEWEFAARAGSASRFWWGNQHAQGYANCAECGSLWDAEMTSPVGRFKPNPFGLHDTAGNVFEWVADCWNDSFEHAPEDGGALKKKDCGIRVIRGGAWSFPAKEIRSANRWRDFQPRSSDDTGFRLARSLDDS